jgi:hypothetical protein
MDADLAPRCLEFANELTRLYLKSAPPFSLDPLVEHFGVCEVRERPLDRDACLVAESGHLFIDVNSMYPLVRRRLSIAHEIGHLIVKHCSPDGPPHKTHEDPEIEGLCNRLAARLLVPNWAVRRYFDADRSLSNWQSPLRCATVLRAASEFGISVDAMASRVFCESGLAPHVVSVIWRITSNSTRPGSAEALRITSAWHQKQAKIYIPRNKTAPLCSVIRKASEQQGVFCATEDVSLGTLRGRFVVEAVGFGLRRAMEGQAQARSVLSLFSSESKFPAPLESQESN